METEETKELEDELTKLTQKYGRLQQKNKDLLEERDTLRCLFRDHLENINDYIDDNDMKEAIKECIDKLK